MSTIISGDVEPAELPRATTDEEEIARLAALPVLEYERARKDAAQKLNCRPINSRFAD